MTPDDVLDLPPGRETDMLIAEHVFGYVWIRGPRHNHEGDRTIYRWLIHPVLQKALCSPLATGDEPIAEGWYFDGPHYSTEIADAWEVVERLRELWRTDDPEEIYWQFVDCQEYGWRVDVMWSHHDGDVPLYSVSALTLPHAICAAALLVMLHMEGGKR